MALQRSIVLSRPITTGLQETNAAKFMYQEERILCWRGISLLHRPVKSHRKKPAKHPSSVSEDLLALTKASKKNIIRPCCAALPHDLEPQSPIWLLDKRQYYHCCSPKLPTCASRWLFMSSISTPGCVSHLRKGTLRIATVSLRI